MKPISWDDFFARFDLLDLAFAYEDDPSGTVSKNREILQGESKPPSSDACAA